MAARNSDGDAKETPVEIDLNWKQLVNKEFRQAGQWDSLWSNVFWEKDIPDSDAERKRVIRSRIEELEARLQKNKEEMGELAALRSTQRSTFSGTHTLERFDFGKHAHHTQDELQAAFTKSFRS